MPGDPIIIIEGFCSALWPFGGFRRQSLAVGVIYYVAGAAVGGFPGGEAVAFRGRQPILSEWLVQDRGIVSRVE